MTRIGVIILCVIFGSISWIDSLKPPVDGNFTIKTPDRNPPKDIDFFYFFEQCAHKGDGKPVRANDYVFGRERALRTYWDYDQLFSKPNWQTDQKPYRGFDDVKGIFDCTLTVKLPKHDDSIPFQELMFGSLYDIKMGADKTILTNVSTEVKKLDPENTLANKGLKELQAACKDAYSAVSNTPCSLLGCVIISYSNITIKACSWRTAFWNIDNTIPNWYTRDDISIRVLLIGRFNGKDKTGKLVKIAFPPFYPKITVDITRLYAGPCVNSDEFNCLTYGVCIKYSLVCEGINMRNCPIYSQSNSDDFNKGRCEAGKKPAIVSPKDPNIENADAMRSLIIFWVILGILLGILALYILNYCFWRPGYLIWRCGRLRNCGKYGNCCYKLCNKSSKSNVCSCCKTQGQFDTTEPIFTASSKYPIGNGFHLRENR